MSYMVITDASGATWLVQHAEVDSRGVGTGGRSSSARGTSAQYGNATVGPAWATARARIRDALPDLEHAASAWSRCCQARAEAPPGPPSRPGTQTWAQSNRSGLSRSGKSRTIAEATIPSNRKQR